MNFLVNGEAIKADVDLRTSLLDLLRDHLHLTGTKKGCNQGACGACTVLVDGERINCLPGAGGAISGPADHHDRGAWRRRGAASAAARVHRARRLPVRLLHARPDLLGDRHGREIARGVPSHVTADLAAETMRARPRRAARAHERQSLPLRRLQRHRRRDRRDLARERGAHDPLHLCPRHRRRRRRARWRRAPARSISAAAPTSST